MKKQRNRKAREQQHSTRVRPQRRRTGTRPAADSETARQWTRPAYLMPVAQRCATGEHVPQLRDPALHRELGLDATAREYAEVLLTTALDCDADVLARQVFHETARFASAWRIGEEVLAHLLAVLCSAVDEISTFAPLTNSEPVLLARSMSPHPPNASKLLALMRFALDDESVRAEIKASQEWIEATATLARAWIVSWEGHQDRDQTLVDAWTHIKPRFFLSDEYKAFMASCTA